MFTLFDRLKLLFLEVHDDKSVKLKLTIIFIIFIIFISSVDYFSCLVQKMWKMLISEEIY